MYYDKVYDTSKWDWRKYSNYTHQYEDVGEYVSVSIAPSPV
jgi:hypothetical protein